ncbi:hypothetical protein GA707_16410 [Nostocoides sp. F2B08]|uniref:hypothetical protein n=1 Tax=Nostocoides sp. F2B08 TaxID=2653936 RepID=UPI0012638AC7|nr:hypothetical protein [Tetrasphaera sp. F2B08]KAB7742478.1 hypothetical protein GA707_16410 [Tetrasphaera sp. F2B08]
MSDGSAGGAGDPALPDRIAAAILGSEVDGTAFDPESAEDHLAVVRRAAAAERAVKDLLAQSVSAARGGGHSWAAIGDALGLSRQAVQQRFGGTWSPPDGARVRRVGPVTAIDEMSELEIAGRQGWRTVGAGILHHVVERTDTQWEHRRVVWTRPTNAYETEGWTVAVRAFPWLYLVRDLEVPPEQ